MSGFFRWGAPPTEKERLGLASARMVRPDALASRQVRLDAAMPVITMRRDSAPAPTRPALHSIHAMASGGDLALTIYGLIGDDPFNDDDATTINVKNVKRQIDAAAAFSKIVLRINSPGGDAFEATAIYNLLRAQGKPIECYVDGIAASAASVIAMCGDTITMGTGAMLMIHNAWGMCIGSAADFEKEADTLRRISASIADIYVVRTGKSLKQIKALMDAETWLDAQECLAGKFCTAIASRPAEESAKALAAAARAFDLDRIYKNTPTKLRRSA